MWRLRDASSCKSGFEAADSWGKNQLRIAVLNLNTAHTEELIEHQVTMTVASLSLECNISLADNQQGIEVRVYHSV